MIKLMRFLKPFRLPIALTMLLVFFQSLSDLYLPTLMSEIVNTGVVKGDTDFIWRTGGWMLLVAFGGAICSVAASYLSSRTASGFGRDLRRSLFARVSAFSLQEFDQFGTASLIIRNTNDITQVQNVVLMILRMMIMAPMMAIGGTIMAVSKDATLSLVLVVILPLLAGVIFLVAGRAIPLFKALQVKLDKLNLVVRERLTGTRVIRAFNQTEHEEQRFLTANQDLRDTAIRVNRIMAALMPILMLAMNLTSVAIVWFGAIRIDRGDMQVGDMMAFIQYAMQILFSLIMLSMMFVMIPRAAASATRINEVLQTQPSIVDPPQEGASGATANAAVSDAASEGVTSEASAIRGTVEFRNVTFRYPGAEQPALHNISFTAGPGEVTAIIGGTGSGKSALISLIPRFFDVEEGAILVDGVDVRELTQEALRAKIGFVPQQAILFAGSVADNIRFGKENATDEEVQQAAETAQAAEFVSAMKEGYNSTISQGGTNVSGGQKQRLSIARALVRRPEVYIFDDSFSALDFKTDARLRAALRQETREATLLMVAQRVGTVMDADRIIVLDEGKVVGMGTHKELLATCPVYREIAASQLAEEELA